MKNFLDFGIRSMYPCNLVEKGEGSLFSFQGFPT